MALNVYRLAYKLVINVVFIFLYYIVVFLEFYLNIFLSLFFFSLYSFAFHCAIVDFSSGLFLFFQHGFLPCLGSAFFPCCSMYIYSTWCLFIHCKSRVLVSCLYVTNDYIGFCTSFPVYLLLVHAHEVILHF